MTSWLTYLLEHRGKSLVVCGSNDPDLQKLVAGINHMLDNYGSTLDLERTLQIKQGNDRDLTELLEALDLRATELKEP